jgi:hypothetical protein
LPHRKPLMMHQRRAFGLEYLLSVSPLARCVCTEVCRERAISHKVDVELLWRPTSPFDPLLYRKPLTMHERSVVRVKCSGCAWHSMSRESPDCLPCRSGVRRQVDLTLLASILSFVCAAVSETLTQFSYEQPGLSAPVRSRTMQRAGDVPCGAASRANKP